LIRTFVGLGLPEGVRAALGRLVESLRGDAPGVRWVEPANLHLTLAFLGDVAEAAMPGLIGAVSEAARAPLPFSLEVRGLGAFPNARRPRVIWAGLAGEWLPRLFELQATVAAACAGVGHRPDERFHPHVTLGRFRPGRVPDVTRLVADHAEWTGGVIEVAEVRVYASELGPSGASYRVLGGCALGMG
jgi:2'-5' RNA ligase